MSVGDRGDPWSSEGLEGAHNRYEQGFRILEILGCVYRVSSLDMATESHTQPQARFMWALDIRPGDQSRISSHHSECCQPHPDSKGHRKSPIHLNSLALDRSCIEDSDDRATSDFPPTYIKRKCFSGKLISSWVYLPPVHL